MEKKLRRKRLIQEGEKVRDLCALASFYNYAQGSSVRNKHDSHDCVI